MLQSIRDKTSGWIAYFIIGLISIPFALWGVNSYLGGGEQQPAAVVDGNEISPRQLDYAYARYRDRLRSVFGGTLPAAFDDENTLKEQVLTQIIEEQVLLNFVQDRGFRVGDKKLFENIQSMSSFHRDGKFDKQLYRDQLASQGYVPAQFEQELRQTSEMGQLSQVIRASAFTVPKQAESYQNLQNQARKLRTLTFENKSDSIDVTDQEIVDYYNEQSGLYMSPARVKVDYIEVSLDRVESGIEVSEDQLRDRYAQMADQLTSVEVRQASHILITVNTDASDEEDQAAMQKLVELKKRVDAGEDFATLAKEHSQDPGSAEDGGDLGEVERGMMVKAFESVLFALQPDEVSDPVKTRFGWHLIKLHKIAGGDKQSFESAKATLEQELKSELAENQIYDLVENLSNIGYEQPDSLLPASEQLDLKIETTDWFTRGQGQGISNQEKFRQAAFSDDVLNKNRNSETLELSDNRVIIMHLNAHEPAKRQTLDMVRESVREALQRKKGREMAQTQGSDLLEKIKKQGLSLDEAAEEAGLSVVDSGYVSRATSAVERDVLNAAFTLTRPQGGAPVFEGVSETDGDYTIIEYSDTKIENKDGDDQVNKALTDASAEYDFQALVKKLAEEASIIRTPVAELQ